jgi:hypothetical protein
MTKMMAPLVLFMCGGSLRRAILTMCPSCRSTRSLLHLASSA